LLLLLASGCKTGRDYPHPGEPRYAGGPAPELVQLPPRSDTIRVATFNIAFGREIDSALVDIRAEPELRRADVLLLQEMDADATRRIAQSLGMWYVYYPAIFHNRTKRDFGNAVLSRWPIIEDAKVVLPHASRYAGTHRIATAATIQIGDRRVRAYSTHLGTVADIGGAARRAQLGAIVADGRQHDIAVIAGDMNEGDLGQIAVDAGYLWPTANGPRTTALGRWDHIFIRGLAMPSGSATGTVAELRGSSDHHPVWVTAIMTHQP
jgi:endonuclease/exonuclease/phosphatase family metal-dependent hydrolase